MINGHVIIICNTWRLCCSCIGNSMEKLLHYWCQRRKMEVQ